MNLRTKLSSLLRPRLSGFSSSASLCGALLFASGMQSAEAELRNTFMVIGNTYISDRTFLYDADGNYLGSRRNQLPVARESLILSIETANQQAPLDFVVWVGEITQSGKPEEYQVVKDVIAASPVPVYATPGNHDIPRGGTLATFEAETGFAPFYTFEKGRSFFTARYSSGRYADSAKEAFDAIEGTGRYDYVYDVAEVPLQERIGLDRAPVIGILGGRPRFRGNSALVNRRSDGHIQIIPTESTWASNEDEYMIVREYDEEIIVDAYEDGRQHVQRWSIKVDRLAGTSSRSLVAADYLPADANEEALLEVGQFDIRQASADSWETVNISQGFEDPVVIVGPPTFNGGHPSTMRVRQVNSTSFGVQIDEWDYLDGAHTRETVSFLVAESGTQTVDGVTIEAGKVSGVTHRWTNVTLDSSIADPVVLCQVASQVENSAVTVRVRNVTPTGFQVLVQEEQGNNRAHAGEEVHYVVLSASEFELNGFQVKAGNTTRVNDRWRVLPTGDLGNEPAFLGQMSTTNGGDAAALRIRYSGSQVETFVEEEASKDTEIRHANETVSWLAIELP